MSGFSFWLSQSTFLICPYLGMLKGWFALICSVKTINPHWILTSYLNCLPLAGPSLRTLRIGIWTLALVEDPNLQSIMQYLHQCSNCLCLSVLLGVFPSIQISIWLTLLEKGFRTPTHFISRCPALSLAENLSPEMQLLISYVYMLNKYLLLLFWHTTIDIL